MENGSQLYYNWGLRDRDLSDLFRRFLHRSLSKACWNQVFSICHQLDWDKIFLCRLPNRKLCLYCPCLKAAEAIYKILPIVARTILAIGQALNWPKSPEVLVLVNGCFDSIWLPETVLIEGLTVKSTREKDRFLKMTNSAVLANANLLESLPLRGLVSDNWMRLAMSVHQEDKPCFLVSIDFHTNVIFNQAALDLLNATPEQMLVQSLPKLWVPQSQILPVNYERKVPSELTDFNTHLRQQTKLESFVFENWRSNLGEGTATWTRWTDDIEYVELPSGGNARKMVVLGFEVV